MKGTDGSGKKRVVKRDSLEYWKSLDVPVLIASYEAGKGTLRGRWAHSVGFDGPDRGGSSVTIHMDPDILIGPAWAETLGDDLSLIRALRRGDIPRPLPVHVRVHSWVTSVDTEQLATAVVQTTRASDWPFAMASSGAPGVELYVSKSVLRAATPLRWTSASLHVPQRVLRDPDVRTLANDLVVLVAMALTPVDSQAARAVMTSSDPGSRVWTIGAVVECLGPLLWVPESADFAFRLATHLLAREREGDGKADGDFVVDTLLLNAAGASPDVFDAYAIEARRAFQVTSRADAGESARRRHNLGHVYKVRGDYASARALFQEAASLDARYESDASLRRHIGSCEWELGHYMQSAIEYQRALDLGFDPYARSGIRSVRVAAPSC